jgi:hypothetical protein
MFQTKIVEKIKTHILCSVTFFQKSRRLRDNLEKKHSRTGQATDDMAHAQCMLDTHKHTLRICNIHFFFTSPMVARRRFKITLQAHCLTCLSNQVNFAFQNKFKDSSYFTFALRHVSSCVLAIAL